MNQNFPNREPVIVHDQELHVVRRLPSNAEVKVRPGERINGDHVIAKTDPRHLAVRINIADQLGVSPNDVNKHMLRPVGSTFAAGEAMAKMRKGLRNTVVASPMTGLLLSIDSDTGVGLLAPGTGGDIRSLVSGDVEYVDGRQSIAIRTVGSRLFGIVGVGPSVQGTLCLAVSGPGEEAQPDRITPDMRGKVVVAGASVSASTLRRLMDVGAAGVIVGGIVEREVSACFGVPAEDRLSPWRIGPSDTGIGDSMTTSIAIVATEGFGSLPIAADVFAFLKRYDATPVTLITTTRMSGFLARPQIISVNQGMLDEDAPAQPITLSAETRVRIIDQANLGVTGTVAERPKRVRRADGVAVDVMTITTPDNKSRVVAANNVEVIA
ncbi:MAG TPA: hypothetical protein VEQ36_15545 [Thermomicrobiales bacterium]|nr:hypothetical protein [Thermomicrobiales bacterium]